MLGYPQVDLCLAQGPGDKYQSPETGHITSIQYCGGCSVHWRFSVNRGDNISTLGDSFSTVEGIQYWEGELQYCGGI